MAVGINKLWNHTGTKFKKLFKDLVKLFKMSGVLGTLLPLPHKIQNFYEVQQQSYPIVNRHGYHG